jgi:hypothetical protein
MEAAARTARHNHHEPGEGSLTRHGMLKLQAADALSPVTDLHARMLIINTDRAESDCIPSLQSWAQTSRSGPLASIATLPGNGHAIADISRKPKSP